MSDIIAIDHQFPPMNRPTHRILLDPTTGKYCIETALWADRSGTIELPDDWHDRLGVPMTAAEALFLEFRRPE